MPLDEILPGFNILAHQGLEDLICLHGVLDRDLLEDPLLRVHGRIPELLGVHLPKTLVPLDRDPLLPQLGEDPFHVLFAVSIPLLLSLHDREERGLGDVDIAGLDQPEHIPVEEGEEKGPDMGAVDIGISHDHDMVVSCMVDLELLANTRADGRDERLDLGIFQDLVLPGLLHVQDLPPQREDGLEFPVPSLLGAPACRISFHDIDLALFRVTLGAVCQLAGQA